eukprot:TRINITY_DN29735_c0_g1_i1.p1 TRINITY_DN29735_c0_g1~~TRINITY_DN29735_c0_g1_i1.p1  ORF type:complete len:650 (+),score=78.28 TRINITY_DN29735_c0_g1_i1:104-2053(+)
MAHDLSVRHDYTAAQVMAMVLDDLDDLPDLEVVQRSQEDGQNDELLRSCHNNKCDRCRMLQRATGSASASGPAVSHITRLCHRSASSQHMQEPELDVMSAVQRVQHLRTALSAPDRLEQMEREGRAAHELVQEELHERQVRRVTAESAGPASSRCKPSKAGDEQTADALLIFLLCCVSVVEGADMALLRSLFRPLQYHLDLSITELTVMSLLQRLSHAAAAPFWAALADDGPLGCKSILVLGCVAQGSIICTLPLVKKAIPLMMLCSLNGALLASLRPVSHGIVAEVTAEQQQGLANSWILGARHLGLGVGTFAGLQLSGRCMFGFLGWQVAFFSVGASSVLTGILVAYLMKDPRQNRTNVVGPEQGEGLLMECRRLAGYCRIPSFLVLVIQGCIGSVAWNAMGYRSLFHELHGLTKVQDFAFDIMGHASSACGTLFGGALADFLVQRCLPVHGRPFVAQVSIVFAVLLSSATFLRSPEGNLALWFYASCVNLIGFTSSWCEAGVTLPMLSQLAPSQHRTGIIAWQIASAGICAAIVGNLLVGAVAQQVFGYKLPDVTKRLTPSETWTTFEYELPRTSEELELLRKPENVAALGRTLTLTVVGPFLACLLLYSFLHWCYPRDLQRANVQHEATMCGHSQAYEARVITRI